MELSPEGRGNFEKELIVPLNNGGIPLDEIGRQVLESLDEEWGVQNVSPELRADLRKKAINELISYRREHGKSVSPEKISNFVHKRSTEILDEQSERNESNEKGEEIKSIEIMDTYWDEIEKYGVKRPREGEALRGGAARIIARVVFGIEQNPNDSLSDTDGYALKGKHRQEIADYYNSGINGFPEVENFGDDLVQSHFEKSVDLTMNQLLIIEDTLYCRDSAINDMKDKIIAPVLSRKECIYGKDILLQDPVFLDAGSLYRLVNAYIRGKGDSMKIPVANMTQEGLNHTKESLEKYILIILAKIIKDKPPSSVDDMEELIFKLQRILYVLDTFEIRTDMYFSSVYTPEERIEELIDRNPDFLFVLSEMNEVQEAQWLMKKFIKMILKEYMDMSELREEILDELGEKPTQDFETLSNDLPNQHFSNGGIKELLNDFIGRIQHQGMIKPETIEGNHDLIHDWKTFIEKL